MNEIERLAKVLRAVETPSVVVPPEGLRTTTAEIEYFNRVYAEACVRAILRAMREPAETQYDALCATDKMWREQTSEAVWKTYIDALLNEP